MKQESNEQLALSAMYRASIKAIEKAAHLDLKIPEWKNGRVIFVNAKEKLKRLSYT
mgnify:FL=1